MSNTTTQVAPPRDALNLREAGISIVEGAGGAVVADDGTITLHIIRPTVGRGRGNHLYEADMLKEHAHIFGGWKMYVNHLSEKARKALGGLPRDVRDLGGRIVESWWDDSVPADGRYQQGAVVARAKPTPFMRDLIENDPDIVEASISAQATGVREGSVGGKKVWIVEGIRDTGSVDWVTEAGAGGKVVTLLEGALEGHTAEEWSADSDISEAEFTEFLRTDRPHLITEAPAESQGEEEDIIMEITPEMLLEALQSDAGREFIQEAVTTAVTEAVGTAVEEALTGEREMIRAEARADADHQIALRDMRDAAHAQITEASSRWPQSWADESKARFELVEGEPTPALDVIDALDEEGAVVKTAAVLLSEAVDQEIARQNALLADARPTRVRGQGERGDAADKTKSSEGTLYGAVLQEAGIDPETAWA